MFNHKRKLKKRGNIDDPVQAVGIFLVIVITVFVMYLLLSNFNTTIKGVNATNYSQVTDFADTYEDRFVKGWDYGLLFLAILFPLFSYIAARKISTDPRMMILTFLVLGFLMLIFMLIANMYGAFLDNSQFADFIAQTTFMPIIMPNLLYYGLIYTLIVLIGLFTKPQV